jgi:hypothetical protein
VDSRKYETEDLSTTAKDYVEDFKLTELNQALKERKD